MKRASEFGESSRGSEGRQSEDDDNSFAGYVDEESEMSGDEDSTNVDGTNEAEKPKKKESDDQDTSASYVGEPPSKRGKPFSLLSAVNSIVIKNSQDKIVPFPRSVLDLIYKDELQRMGYVTPAKSGASSSKGKAAAGGPAITRSLSDAMGCVSKLFMLELIEEVWKINASADPNEPPKPITKEQVFQAFENIKKKRSYPATQPKNKMFRFE